MDSIRAFSGAGGADTFIFSIKLISNTLPQRFQKTLKISKHKNGNFAQLTMQNYDFFISQNTLYQIIFQQVSVCRNVFCALLKICALRSTKN